MYAGITYRYPSETGVAADEHMRWSKVQKSADGAVRKDQTWSLFNRLHQGDGKESIGEANMQVQVAVLKYKSFVIRKTEDLFRMNVFRERTGSP